MTGRHRHNFAGARQRGISMLWTVLTIIVMILMAGLAIDMVYVVLAAQQLQIGADGGALAGALEVRRDLDDARNAAQTIGAANDCANVSIQLNYNDGNAPDGDIVIGFYHLLDSTFTVTETNANAVRVNARRTDGSLGGALPTLIGGMAGVESLNVDRYAIAMVYGDVGPGIIVLDPTKKCAFDMRGTASLLQIKNGAVMVNSDHSSAACNSGQPALDVAELYIHGGYESKFPTQVQTDANIFTGVDPVPDPLAGLPEPNYASLPDQGGIKVTGGSTENASPGYYSGGFDVRNGSLTLEPGVYILGGSGLDVNGGNLYAEGCMFFIVDDGELDLRGNGEIEITPPNPLSYPAGPSIPAEYVNARVSLFQQRSNTNAGRVLGTNQFDIAGTIYMKNAHLEIGGTSNSFSNGMIVDTLLFHGDGEFIIDYDDRFPRIPRNVFIVE